MRSKIVTSLAVGFLTSALGGAASAEPTLWIDDADGRLGKVDVATGAVTIVGVMRVTMTDIAFDPAGSLYGISSNSLYRINPASAAITLVGNLGAANLNSLVFDSAGNLYAASSSLYSISVTTGAASLIGNGGTTYRSSGDLAFVGGALYLSSSSPTADSLIRLNTTTGAGTALGPIGIDRVFGLATSDNINLYAVAGTGIYSVNTFTGAANLLVNYGGQGLSAANGTAFISEAIPIPEPATYVLFAMGISLLSLRTRLTRRNGG